MLVRVLYVFLCIIPVIRGNYWYSYQFGSGYGNREELVIRSIDAVDNFTSEYNVEKWKSVSLMSESYALGITQNGITLLHASLIEEQSDFRTRETFTSLNTTKILDANIFEYNDQIIVLVAIELNDTEDINSAALLWFKVIPDNQLVQIWEWKLLETPSELNIFQSQNKYYLLIGTELNGETNNSKIDLFEFELGQKNNHWFHQSLHLENTVTSSSITVYQDKHFLCIPQKSKLLVYKFKNEKNFVLHQSLNITGIEFLTTFNIAHNSFVATGGTQASIYKFTPNGLQLQSIEGMNTANIDYWMSIPVKTYRDDEILIAERSLDFSSHKTHSLQVVMHHNEKFTPHDEMMCDYFGEISHGFNCLVEEENVKGIQDATALVVGKNIAILVPHENSPSKMFTIHTAMEQRSSPIEKEIEKFNRKKMDIQKKLENINRVNTIPHGKKVRGNPEFVGESPKSASMKQLDLNDTAEFVNIDTEALSERISNLQKSINEMLVKLPQLGKFDANRTVYDNLIINGSLEVRFPSEIKEVTTENFHGLSTDETFSDIYDANGLNVALEGTKRFLNLSSNTLDFKKVNEIPRELIANNMSILTMENVQVLSEVNILNDVILQTINNNLTTDQMVQVGSMNSGIVNLNSIKCKHLTVENTANKFPMNNENSDETVFVKGNLSVVNINGENFDELVKKLCLRNIRTFVPNRTTIQGDVSISQEALTLNLDQLAFPQQYIMSRSNSFSEITGNKTFTNQLVIGELTTRGTVNGINLNEVATLSGRQSIPGSVNFEKLKVTESLDVQGKILTTPEGTTKEFKKTLRDTNKVFGNVNFNHLEVDGLIVIGNMFNGTNLETVLKDVVYKDMESVEISAVKLLPNGLTVANDLQITSNSLNSNLDVNTLVNKETIDELLVENLNGDVTFENLILMGTFNDIDINLLDEQSVKISGEQFIGSELIFEEDLQISQLEITSTLNEIPVEDYVYKNSDVSLDSLNIRNINTETINVSLILDAQIDNFNVEDFDERRFSLSNNQTISNNYFIESVSIIDLNATNVNDFAFEDIFGLDKYTKTMTEMIFDNKLAIKDLVVENSIQIGEVNNMQMDLILNKCISSQRGDRKMEFVFENDVRVKDITVDTFNNVEFEELRQNLVFKDEKEVEIKGTTVYLNGFRVENYIQSTLLNGIYVGNIMRKKDNQEIIGPILIDAPELSLIGKTEIEDTVNGIDMSYIKDRFLKFDESIYHINSDVVFERMAFINDFLIDNLNGLNMQTFLQDLVPIHSQQGILVEKVTFANKVTIEENLKANGFNGIDLNSLKEDLVYITQDAEIDGAVTFTNFVRVNEELSIDTDLLSQGIYGINLSQWMQDAIFINKGLIPLNLTFDSAVIQEDINAKFLNNIDLDSLILLRTDGEIKGENFKCIEATSFKNIIVKNLVNGYKLPEEFQNSLMAQNVQEVQDNIVFNGIVLINGNLRVENLINEHDLSKMVTINTPQNLTANYEFSNKTFIEFDANIHGQFNNNNLTEWMQKSMKKQSRDTKQIVPQNWQVYQNITFENNLIGNGLINNMNVENIKNTVIDRRSFKSNMETDLLENYKNTCYSINNIINTCKKQMYRFKYLEHFSEHLFEIKNIHAFEFMETSYLLISNSTCFAKLYIWSPLGLHFERDIEIGHFDQIITVKDFDNLYFVTRDDSMSTDCQIGGSNIWKFLEETQVLLHKLLPMQLLQESKIPGTFYGMDHQGVIEYRITTGEAISIHPMQRWIIPTENAQFLSHGLKTGLAVRNGHQLFRLIRESVQKDIVFDINMPEIIIGNVSVENNNYIPGAFDGEMLIMKVGHPRWQTLMAVASIEHTNVKGDFDTIKIYEDPTRGIMYHKIPAYKPSSLMSLEFEDNGETLLAFLEDKKTLQLYEYKGIEGFKFHSKSSMEAKQLLPLRLPNKSGRKSSFIAAYNDIQLDLIQVVMDGNQLMVDKVDCNP